MTPKVTHAALSLFAAVFLHTSVGHADTVQLPPSVGATPIEIPFVDPDAPMVMQGQGTGRTSATPIEIPRINPDAPFQMMTQKAVVLPPVLPASGLERLDPRANPGMFAGMPVPVTDPVSTARVGQFAYAQLRDGTIYGDTNFGYAHFGSMADYRRFLGSH